MELFLVFLILAAIILAVVVMNFRVVPQASVFVVERMGVYYSTWSAGIHFKNAVFGPHCQKGFFERASG